MKTWKNTTITARVLCVVVKKRKEKPMRGMRELSHDGKVDEDQKTGKG